MKSHNKPLKFSKRTLDFLKKAGKQKNPNWLDRNKDEYETQLRKPLVELAESVKLGLRQLAPDYHFPSKGLARIKRPDFKVVGGQAQFKDWVSMIASRPSASRFESHPHLFFGIFPNEKESVVIAGGLWQPSSHQTRMIREAIHKDPEPFHELFSDTKFQSRFKSGFYKAETATRVPRGFSADHKDINWILLKRFVVYKVISMKDFTSPLLSESVIKDYKQALRLNQLLDKAIQYNWPPR